MFSKEILEAFLGGLGPSFSGAELLTLKARAAKCSELEFENLQLRQQVERLKRKGQYVADMAYNKAIDDMELTGAFADIAKRMRKVPRHKDEFGRKG